MDRSADRRYRVRAQYLLACDGGRSIGPKLGVTLEGQRNLASEVSIHMTADLSGWARDPDVLIRWSWLPETGQLAVLVPMGPERWGPDSEEWVFHLNYPHDDPRSLDDARVQADMRRALGIGGHPSRSTRFPAGRSRACWRILLRPPLLLLSGVTLVAYLRYRPKAADAKERLFRPVKTAPVVILLALLGAGLQYQGDYLQKFRLAGQAAQFTDIDNLNERLKSSDDAGSAYKEKVRYKSYLDILRVLPRAVFYFMFSPLPWQVNSLKQSLGLLDSACLILIFYYFLKGVRDLYVVNKKFALALLAFLVGLYHQQPAPFVRRFYGQTGVGLPESTLERALRYSNFPGRNVRFGPSVADSIYAWAFAPFPLAHG